MAGTRPNRPHPDERAFAAKGDLARDMIRRALTSPLPIAYYLARAPLEATVADLVRVAGCRWKIEESFQSAKNECGLDQYEVRRYRGWAGTGTSRLPCSPRRSSP
ncbi:hypothetical protein ABZ590_02880 [Streptomyces hirsutus]|uniref:hypothetical protein n=1 Tax=Streptomyces hirsutus TaxID=35620 RepID=UPI003401ACD5